MSKFYAIKLNNGNYHKHNSGSIVCFTNKQDTQHYMKYNHYDGEIVQVNIDIDKDQQIAELKAENERLKNENKVLKEIRGLKSKELKKRPHELTQKEAYQKGWENAISETIRTFEFNYGKDKVELVEERDKYFSDIYRIGGYKFTIEDLQQQLKEKDERIETLQGFLERTTFRQECTKQVCEKIRKNIVKYVYGGNLFDIKGFKEFLDQIEEGQ